MAPSLSRSRARPSTSPGEPQSPDGSHLGSRSRRGRHPQMKIRIVARTSRLGLGHDAALLRDAFAEWREPPSFSHSRSIGPLRAIFSRRDPEECILFLERVAARWLRRAGRYALIVNQEWYSPRRLPLLRWIDHVLCKTRHAQEIFSAHHPSVHYLGFTSVDRRTGTGGPDYTRFLHLAGGSRLKGTSALLDVWRRHPEWPVLTVVQHAREGDPAPEVPGNVELITEYLPQARILELQNACGIHLCPSLSEGWGHYIVEAMSCCAVPLVTDAPPMNELVAADRGVLVPWERCEPRKLGTNFHVDRPALERAIAGLIEMPVAEKARMGAAARAWFEENQVRFRERLHRLTTRLLSNGAT